MDDIRQADDLLIDLIYSAMLGETSWQTFLEQLSASSPGSISVLFSHDIVRGEGLVGLHAGCDESVIQAYDSHYSAVNPWAPYCAARPPGRAVIGHDAYPHSEFVKSEYYNDFLVPAGVKSGAGCTVDKGPDRTFLISTMTVEDDPDAIRPVADQFARLAPHLKRAADFYRKGPKLRAVNELGGSLFDAVHTGMIMVGEGCRIKSVSRAAETMLAGSSSIRMSPTGRIAFSSEAAQGVLMEMLERNYSGARSASFHLEGVKVTLVHMRKDGISLYFEGPTVVLLVESVEAGARTFDQARFVDDYRLSAAEARALAGIVLGRTVDEIAREASLSRETIRSQVKSLYAKVGVRSRTDLVRLVFTAYAVL